MTAVSEPFGVVYAAAYDLAVEFEAEDPHVFAYNFAIMKGDWPNEELDDWLLGYLTHEGYFAIAHSLHNIMLQRTSEWLPPPRGVS